MFRLLFLGMRSFFYLCQFLSKILFGMFLAWIMGACFFALFISRMTPPCPEHTQGIVVFTGENGRVECALALYRKGAAPFLHISGKNKKKRITPHISQDDALNTKENVEFTLVWIKENKIKSVRLVTSDYHMPRCLALARPVWPATIIPHPLHLSLKSSTRVFTIFKEYNKWVWVKARSLNYSP